MRAGELRHRITVESKAVTVDPVTGYRSPGWVVRLASVPAAFLPGPGREYLASEALRTEVSGRFLIRWSSAAAAITAGDRVVWGSRVFAVKAPPLVDASARRELTLMVAEEGTDGA